MILIALLLAVHRAQRNTSCQGQSALPCTAQSKQPEKKARLRAASHSQLMAFQLKVHRVQNMLPIIFHEGGHKTYHATPLNDCTVFSKDI
ncbi:hypothetical protein BJ878DRAFT_323831 [Calycina marina]|uniref:Secreted protein n=1 Tax=Calycina marina TaxID=1763456 RepID=A0A9P7YVL9_9HELO|nr:hypothetical protein BJ878DRAFT_323831 [Calycina marina]